MQPIDRWAKISLILIGVIVVFAALDVLQNFATPVVLAIVTAVILSPVSNRLDARGAPPIVTAFVSFLIGVSAIALLILIFQPAVDRAIAGFPRLYSELSSSVYELQAELRGMKEVEESVKEIVDPDSSESDGGGDATGDSPADAIPGVEDVVLLAPSIAAQVLIFLGTFFFFVLTKEEVYQFASRRLTTFENRKVFTDRLRLAERQVARYFLTISIVNLCLGTAVALVMAWIEMPSPVLWGVAAFVLNYLIYLGPAAFAGTLLIAGIAVFDGPAVVLPMVCYLGLNVIESQFVTPAFLGKSLSVNPLLIFLTVTFFLWLWGPLGAVVAIPLLLWIIALSGLAKQDEAGETG